MLTQHIALVPEADGVDVSELARVSAALQKQVTRDFSSLWGVAATVDAFPYLEDVPVGYWPILVCSGDLGNRAGVHLDRSGQPYALVQASKGWSLAASRACLEMLVNPFGSRTVTAPSLRSDQAPVEFLIEVCGPCEDERHGYSVDGVIVSDFCTPAFFETKHAPAERFSWGGSLLGPLRLTPGGHVSWYDPITDSWWLRNHWGENPVDTKLGTVDRKLLSVRELVQICASARSVSRQLPQAAFEDRETRARQASTVRAQRLRSLLGEYTEPESSAVVIADEAEEVGLFFDEATDLERNEPNRAEAPESVPPPTDRPRIESSPAERTQVTRARASSVPPPLPPPTPRAPKVRAASSFAPLSKPIQRELPRARRRGRFVGGIVGVVGLGALLWAVRPSLDAWIFSQTTGTVAPTEATESQPTPAPLDDRPTASRATTQAISAPTQETPIPARVASIEPVQPTAASSALSEKVSFALRSPNPRRGRAILPSPGAPVATKGASEEPSHAAVAAPTASASSSTAPVASTPSASATVSVSPPPALASEQSAAKPSAPDGIDDLIDTRR